jgi:hypothetical protein
MIQKALGYAGFFGDIVDRNLVVGPRGEQLDSQPQELGSSLVDLQARPALGCHLEPNNRTTAPGNASKHLQTGLGQ